MVATAATVVALAVAAPSALAHVERTSYWPNPAPDTSVSPPAGGAPPKVRSLASALPPRKRTTSRQRAARRRDRSRGRVQVPAFTGAYKGGRSYRARDGRGRVRVVCQPKLADRRQARDLARSQERVPEPPDAAAPAADRQAGEAVAVLQRAILHGVRIR